MSSTLRTPRVTKRRAETRSRMLEAAFEVFASRGFGQTRIEDVCTAAGYTRGAFYSQFDGLDDLFFQIYDQRAAAIVTQLAGALAAVGEDPPLPAQIRRVADVLLLDRDWLLVKTEFLLHASRRPDVAQRLLHHRRQLREAIREHLEGIAAAGLLATRFSSADEAARAAIAAYDGVATQVLLDHDEAAARRWLAELLTTLLDGSAPD